MAQLVALMRAACLTGLATGTGTFSVSVPPPFASQRHLLHAPALLLLWLLLLGRERCGDGVAPLAFEIGGILLVDLLLLFRRRVGARDIEGPVLHEVVIGVAAAGLAAAGEFCVAFGERRGLVFLGLRLLGRVRAGFEIGRRDAPPLRMRAHRRQHDATDRQQQTQEDARRSRTIFPSVNR